EFVRQVEVLGGRPGEAEEVHDQRRGERDDHEEDDEPERHHRHAVAPQPPPEELRGRSRGDLAAGLEERQIAGELAAGKDLGGAHAHALLLRDRPQVARSESPIAPSLRTPSGETLTITPPPPGGETSRRCPYPLSQ